MLQAHSSQVGPQPQQGDRITGREELCHMDVALDRHSWRATCNHPPTHPTSTPNHIPTHPHSPPSHYNPSPPPPGSRSLSIVRGSPLPPSLALFTRRAPGGWLYQQSCLNRHLGPATQQHTQLLKRRSACRGLHNILHVACSCASKGGWLPFSACISTCYATCTSLWRASCHD